MNKLRIHNQIVARRKARVRSRIFGTAEQPRLSIFRSNKYLSAQLIDDENGRTLASVNSKKAGIKKASKTIQADETAKILAESAKKAGIKKAILDRGAYKYHGRVKAFTESLRKEGLKI